MIITAYQTYVDYTRLNAILKFGPPLANSMKCEISALADVKTSKICLLVFIFVVFLVEAGIHLESIL